MESKRILVTGSSGFIGTHLTRHLRSHGHDVLGMDVRDPVPEFLPFHHTCDLLDLDRLSRLVRDLAPEVILHLAARTDLEGKSVQDYSANSVGIANLTKAISKAPSVQRTLFTSSQLVCRAGYIPKGPSDYCPPNPYGASKVLTETEVRAHDGGGPTWCLLRPTTIWGRGMNAHYASFFRHVRHGHYFHAGRKELFKNYGYVGNTVHQYESFLLAPSEAIHGKVFYLADYEPLSLQAWIDRIAAGLGAKKPPTIPLGMCRVIAGFGDLLKAMGMERIFPFNTFRLNNILAEYVYDMSATQAICGPLPFGFQEGVNDLVEWVEEIDQATSNPRS